MNKISTAPVTKKTPDALTIDRSQAKKHLELLGYQAGDNVYMRFFVPDGDPRYGTRAAARKAEKLNWEEVERYQNQGYGVYFVINGGGHTDKEVKTGRALFWEWDDRPIEDQIFAWQALNLPEPSLQVETRKSIHNYLRADLTKEQWLELQQDLLIYTQSDQKLKNPSRVLRLAGCWHIKPGFEPIRCDIIHESGKVYTYEELRVAIPQRPQPELPTLNYQPSNPDDIPLYQFLTKDDRSLIDRGAGQGSRNDSGAKLARNLIGTAQRLNHLGIRFSDDPRHLFHDYCYRCTPSLPTREAEAIWKSALKDNPSPSLTDEALETCAKAWLRGRDKSSGRGFGGGSGGNGGGNRRGNGGAGGSGGDGGDGERGGKVVKFPGIDTLTPEQVIEKIYELIAQGATGSYLMGQLNRLSAASQISIQELRRLYSQRLAECDLESDRETNRDEVDILLNLTDQTLNLADYLPEALAAPLTNWCNWLSIRPAVALTALLVGASSLHKVGTQLVIHRNKNFEVPPGLYAALIAASGQLKSPIYSNIIRQPLTILRQEKVEAYKAAMKDYEAAMQAWEQSEDKGDKPQKPADPTLYFFTNATGEAIPVQASKAPDKALLALIDELAGLFKSENAHRGGRGSDKQDLLSYFDGTGQTVLRVSGVKVDVNRIYLSIFGTIQPEVLKGHMSDCSDPDGQWARFLFVNQPLSFAPLGDDDGQAVDIRSRIADFYRQIERIPEMEYRLSRAAFKRYESMHDHLERLRVTHPKPGMRATFSKMKGIIGRLALNLHVLWELDAGKACPDEEIPLFIMEMAIALAKFYIGQIKLVHADSDDESLPAHIIKLIELSKRLEANSKDGWIKAQMYRDQFDSKKRPSAQQARDWMNEAVTLGYGRTRGTGNRLEYYWMRDNNNDDNNPPPPDNLGKLREDLGKTLPVVETIENKEFEDNLGNLGKGIPNSSTPIKNGYDLDEESYEEGGSPPAPSLSCPQESCNEEPVVDTELGKVLGNPFPNSSLSSLSSLKATQEVFEEQEDVQPTLVSASASPMPEKTSSEAADSTTVEEAITSSVSPSADKTTGVEQIHVGDRATESGQAPEPDFDAFPHSNPLAAWGVKKCKAEEIKSEILAIDNVIDFFALKDNPQYSQNELNWVNKNLLSKWQRDRLKVILEASKKNLLSQQQQNLKAIVEATKKDE